MTDYSEWDEPMDMLRELGASALKVSGTLAVQVVEIERRLKAIRASHEQQQKDLDQIFAVLESIEGRNYAKTQEAIRDCDI